MQNIVILGAPCAGKGTLSKQLEPLGYSTLVPGNLYRKEYKEKTEFGIRAESYWGKGNLCPNEMTNELMKNTIDKMPKTNLIFDGYPRTLNQAEYLDSIITIDLAIDLNISDDAAVYRLLKRREIENRPDDTKEIIRQRIIVYHNNNDKIIAYYMRAGKYKFINAALAIEEVFEKAKEIISKELGK